MNTKIWLEAIDFDDYGGWFADTQYVHKMGSPYLIAPFYQGKPALDAKTTIKIPESGTYTLWVRSRNWIKDSAPGQFTISLDNQRSDTVFGCAESNDWVWSGEVHTSWMREPVRSVSMIKQAISPDSTPLF